MIRARVGKDVLTERACTSFIYKSRNIFDELTSRGKAVRYVQNTAQLFCLVSCEGATENARPDIARPSKLWGLSSRDWTTRHQIKQIATG